MTLKEKFNELVPKEFGGMQEPLLSDCEKVADDYAIEFVEWISKLEFKDSNGWGKLWDNGLYNTKEILELFKKEKGL